MSCNLVLVEFGRLEWLSGQRRSPQEFLILVILDRAAPTSQFVALRYARTEVVLSIAGPPTCGVTAEEAGVRALDELTTATGAVWVAGGRWPCPTCQSRK
ncbi:MAG: hypothetical protein HMLKMBBP_01243 [Planctomycetes bacterium]|nr:hypothetical protein [Planctomycetota bacterium]